MKNLLTLIFFTICFCCSNSVAQVAMNNFDIIKPTSELKLKIPSEKGFRCMGLTYEYDKPTLLYFDYDKFVLKTISILDKKEKTFDLKVSIDTAILNNDFLDDVVLLKDNTVLLLFGEHFITLKGDKIIFNKKINEPINDQWPHHTISNFHCGVSHLLLDRTSNIAYVRIVATDTDGCTKPYFENEILGAYHIDKNELEILPIYYPDFYTKHYVGDIEGLQICPYNDKLIITFIATPEGLIFDYKTKQVQKITLPKSKLDVVPPKWFDFGIPLPIEIRLDHLVETRLYEKLLVMPNNMGFVRFYLDAITLKKSNGTINNAMDKTHTMQVLNPDFSLKQEFLMPNNYYSSYQTFVYKNNLYINNFLDDASDKTNFHFGVFSIDSLFGK